jgi:Ca-activated chloride channel family protein
MYIEFQNPNYLYLLFVIPFFIFLHFYNLRNTRGKALRFVNYEAIARIKGIDFYSNNIAILLFDLSMILTLVFSLSGMTLYTEMTSSSFSYVIAIDSSESMSAKDIIPDRLSASKEAAKNFADSLPYNSKLGVISFSWNTYIEADLSNNKQFIKDSIDNIQLTNVGGTDLKEAITTCGFMLNDEANKAVIIISDGQINVGNAGDFIDEARRKKLLVHTIAVGTQEGGETSYGMSKVDENILRSLAYSTNGKFFRINSREEIIKSFEDIIPLTKRMGSINLSLILIGLTIIIFITKQLVISVTRLFL